VIIRPPRPVSGYALFTEINLPAGFKGARGRRMETPEIYARPDGTVYACGEGDTLAPLPARAGAVAVDPARCQDVVDSIASISHALRAGAVVARQACYLPNVNVGAGGPIVGPTDVRGLFIASGHTCWGIQNGPGTGKIMAEYIFDGRAKSADVESLLPKHYLRGLALCLTMELRLRGLRCAVALVLLVLLAVANATAATAEPSPLSSDSDSDSDSDIPPPSPAVAAGAAEAASNSSLLWGPYRPNLYFGVRPRIPRSLLTGLLWAKVDDYDNPQANFRYTCEQNEGMRGYGWDEYDVRTGGRQTIHDAGNTLDLTIDFAKVPVPGDPHGGHWGARIRGEPRPGGGGAAQPTTVIFFASIDGPGGRLALHNEPNPLGYDGDVTLAGAADGLGEFTLDITREPGSAAAGSKQRHRQSNAYLQHTGHPSYDERPLSRTLVASIFAPAEALWQAKNVLFALLRQVVSTYVEKYGQDNPPPPPQMFSLPNQHTDPANVFLVQKTFTGSFEFDVLYSSRPDPAAGAAAAESADDPAARMTSEALTRAIQQARASFSQRFKAIFKPAAPFTSPAHEQFGKSMLSNLVGGIGYFFGDSLVDRTYAPEYEEENEGFWEEAEAVRARGVPAQPEGAAELFTAVPSRPFFPRGFLWDEGFHLLPIMDWDLDLALQITKSWFSLMDEDGWIAREQVLGPEARSKVPTEFQVQYPHYANPPTLFLILESLAERIAATPETATAGGGGGSDHDDDGNDIRSVHLHDRAALLTYLRSLYPLLKRQYYWFRKTQRGDLKSYDRDAFSLVEGYRWRGRSVRHVLTSGLDDYPRPQPPHPGELHVDLISWVGMMARSLRRIAAVLHEEEEGPVGSAAGDDDSVAAAAAIAEDMAQFEKHEAAILRNIEDLHWDDAAQMYCDATIDEFEEHARVCHAGYIALFPFMTGLMGATHPHLGAVLDLIADPERLWSGHGIRSLSKSDELYGTEENYWRGPIWINMNYLILKNLYSAPLQTTARTAGPHQARARTLYNDLRRAVVTTVFESWRQTGFAWEQYNPEDGHGQRTQHFTGWTSLVVKIMAMPELAASWRDEL
ncbi:Processing alpha glucosidase I, partial [Ascosphaera acerosa]